MGDYQVNDPIVITSREVDQAISKLPQNKAGLDNISAEHLKYGSKRIAPLVAVCFTGFLIHSVLSDSMLSMFNVFINSTDNQFGFKAKHGTDLCIYALKEIVNKYRDNNSSVFMCFIDASKAFDRVNHAKLFF